MGNPSLRLSEVLLTLSKSSYKSFRRGNNEGGDQTARMQQCQGFSRRGPFNLNSQTYPIRVDMCTCTYYVEYGIRVQVIHI